jgi:hypothetical protein
MLNYKIEINSFFNAIRLKVVSVFRDEYKKIYL